jgi:NADH-quinone oxidoreductase subunit A
MSEMLLDYLPVLIFLAIAAMIAMVFMVLPMILAPKNPDSEKLSTYECGFEAFDDARMKFDVKFYLVAILFIVFDLEVVFLFPWAVNLKALGPYAFWTMMVFLAELMIGFMYAWRRGALEWE